MAFKLKSGSGHVKYKVNKFNVASASDAFGRLVFNENGGANVIDLDDDLAAFAIIINIVVVIKPTELRAYQTSRTRRTAVASPQHQTNEPQPTSQARGCLPPGADRWTAMLADFTTSDTAITTSHKAF
ncbi:hypothetical protein BJ166DRAFT_586730 [Pestalotiopsis sp. NC0098]|nr:hypothetical protein BJ166DRAFT_586730 [Pestalotiopsis sp. NC0098]